MRAKSLVLVHYAVGEIFLWHMSPEAGFWTISCWQATASQSLLGFRNVFLTTNSQFMRSPVNVD